METLQSMRNQYRRWLSAVLPYRPMDGRKEVLDGEYAAGGWDYLRGSEELSRFSVVVGYCHHFKPNAALLEVGCGEGILQERLDCSKYSRYVGIDISSEAISRAQGRQNQQVAFIAVDAAAFVPSEKFDLVIFNECLEYFRDPLGLVRRYDGFLNTDGLYVVSIFEGVETVQSRRIWKRLASAYRILSETRVTNGRGYSWMIKVLALRDGF